MHLTRIRGTAILVAIAAVAVASTALAQSGGGYDASFNAFTAGGGTVEGGGYDLQTSIGQPVAGNVSGGSYSLDIGVLAGGSGAAGPGTPTATPTVTPPGDLPFKRFGPQVAKDGVN